MKSTLFESKIPRTQERTTLREKEGGTSRKRGREGGRERRRGGQKGCSCLWVRVSLCVCACARVFEDVCAWVSVGGDGWYMIFVRGSFCVTFMITFI